LAYYGFKNVGRGSILFREQQDIDKATYVTQKEWMERMNKTPQNVQNIQQILKRINTYNPTFEFCAVYQSREGLMGCDVVRPDTKPEEIAKLFHEQEKRPNIEKDDDDDVIESSDW